MSLIIGLNAYHGDEYNVMGLAAYGKQNLMKDMRQIFKTDKTIIRCFA